MKYNMAQSSWSWYWSTAANRMAFNLAVKGASKQEIIDRLLETKWLPHNASIACAIQNWEMANNNVDPKRRRKYTPLVRDQY